MVSAYDWYHGNVTEKIRSQARDVIKTFFSQNQSFTIQPTHAELTRKVIDLLKLNDSTWKTFPEHEMKK